MLAGKQYLVLDGLVAVFPERVFHFIFRCPRPRVDSIFVRSVGNLGVHDVWMPHVVERPFVVPSLQAYRHFWDWLPSVIGESYL